MHKLLFACKQATIRMRTSYYYLHMQINYNYGSYSRKCHKYFGLPQNDIGVGSGRVGRAFALHELAEGYYLH